MQRKTWIWNIASAGQNENGIYLSTFECGRCHTRRDFPVDGWDAIVCRVCKAEMHRDIKPPANATTPAKFRARLRVDILRAVEGALASWEYDHPIEEMTGSVFEKSWRDQFWILVHLRFIEKDGTGGAKLTERGRRHLELFG